jgi:diguanylate cyclase (GGDEF)-like protein/PAS domain S-box-containing protein
MPSLCISSELCIQWALEATVFAIFVIVHAGLRESRRGGVRRKAVLPRPVVSSRRAAPRSCERTCVDARENGRAAEHRLRRVDARLRGDTLRNGGRCSPRLSEVAEITGDSKAGRRSRHGARGLNDPSERAVPKRDIRMAALLRTKRIAWMGALFFVGFLLLLSYLSGRRYKNALDWVEHTHLVRVSLERVLSGMSDLESARRGYVITGNAAFLNGHDASPASVEQELERCRTLVSDNPTQSARMRDVTREVEDKLAFGASVVEARERGDVAEANALVASLRGKVLMDRVSNAIGVMLTEEERLLVARRAAQVATERETIAASAVLALCLLGLLAASFITVQRDANELRQAANELAESEERYRLLVDNVSDLVLLHEPGGELVYVSPSLEPLLGHTPAEAALGGPLALVHPDDAASVREQLAHLGRSAATSAVVTCRLRRRDGEYRWFEFKVAGVNDEHGTLRHFQSLGRDVTARRELEQRLAEQTEQLWQLSLRDGLTGLYNRRGFLELSAQVVRVAERQKHGLALVFIDLDGLKGINDGLGHEQGDRAIGEAAELLRSTCRAPDLIARLGGDEFVVLASEVDAASVQALTARLERALGEANAKPGRAYRLSFSFGLATFDPRTPVPIETLLDEADGRMYEAKLQARRARARRTDFSTPPRGVGERTPGAPS